MQREGRAQDDGYRSTLVPGVRASADASRLARGDRVRERAPAGPGSRATRSLRRGACACRERSRAGHVDVLLIAYLSAAGGRGSLRGHPHGAGCGARARCAEASRSRRDPLGPRTSHDARARRGDAARLPSAGSQRAGRPGGGVRRRSCVEPRAALRAAVRAPRAARASGAWGAMTCSSCWDASGCMSCAPTRCIWPARGGVSASDPTTLAAKRVFGIGDPLLLERRAASARRGDRRCLWSHSTWRCSTGRRRSGPRSDSRPIPAITSALERAGAALGAGRPSLALARRRVGKSTVHTATYSPGRQSPSAREPRCRSASSSPRTRFA